MNLSRRTPEDGEVLAGKVDKSSIYRSGSRDNSVGWGFFASHSEVGAPVLGKHRELLETLVIQEFRHAFSGGETPRGVLLFNPIFSATERNLGFFIS
jgi:hypothetical protein